MISHSWNEEKSKVPAKTTSYLPPDLLKKLFSNYGPTEVTKEHNNLEGKADFNYRTVIGELIYCYVSCRTDIGYGTTIISKFSSTNSDYHHSFLKRLARYLSITRDWGIRYKRRGP